MSDISRFVNEETILVNDPIFSREAIQEYVMHPQKKLNKHKIGNFATHSTKEVFTICPPCEGKHNLDDHMSFKENDLQERSRFLFVQKLCYGYFSPISSKLEKRKKRTSKKNFHCATVNMSSEVISMCVVPIMVRHKLSNRVVKTYAMLNTYSQAMFAKENLLSDVGTQGWKTSITVKTMNREITKSSEALEDLELTQASNGKGYTWNYIYLQTRKLACGQ